VPEVDFPTFRAAAHRLLDPDAFARVDAVYRAVLTVARSEACTLQVLARRSDADTRPAVEATIQRMTVSAVSEAEVLTRLRAAQAGFFLEGTLLRVRLYRHRGQCGFSLRPRLPAPVVARLRTLCAPTAAGAVAIRVATGFSVDALVRLRVGDLIDRGQEIDIGASGGLWRVPAPVAAIVRAGVADHPATTSLGGWPPAHLPVFIRDDAPTPARTMRRQLKSAAARAGVRPVGRGGGVDSVDLQTTDEPPMDQEGGAMRRLSINWKFVEQRRIAVGLTRAQLADRIGAAGETWPVQLWHDGEYDDIPLGILEELCHVLGLQPAELFSPPPRVADGGGV
jgi:DNA-binding Xre family transcriptional regulator